MHTLLEGTVQYELRLVLNKFIKENQFTLEQLNGSILNHPYSLAETADKPIPFRDSVFNGDEKYKLKYNASQARVFLKLFPFIVGPLVDMQDEYFKYIVDLMEIVSLTFSPVVTSFGLDSLEEKIAKHLANFKELFSEQNLLPKHHYMIHIPNMVRQLGPMIRSSCFSFEATHYYFKELAKKQNFKNVTKSLAYRWQNLDCCYLSDAQATSQSHPLFKNSQVFGPLLPASEEEKSILQQKSTMNLKYSSSISTKGPTIKGNNFKKTY